MKLVKAEYSASGEAGKRGFEDLDCYKLALDLMVNAHQVAGVLPSSEKYDLVQQIRRSAKSVTANIAEGYGRYHFLDTLRFYSIARGSLNETLAHFVNAQVLRYIDQEYFAKVHFLGRRTEKALNGLMNYVRRQKAGSDLYGDKAVREDSALYHDDDTQQPPSEEETDA